MSNTCCSGKDAISFLESIIELIPPEKQDAAFREKYETSLNRVRYEISKAIGIAPRVLTARVSRYGKFYSCGNCGASVSIHYNCCHNCGRAIKWGSPRCLTGMNHKPQKGKIENLSDE
ncbi:MAG: hypothetical protein IKB01_05295 [Lachnospiraceae bacterium]|nr:hypothetical protein [Lachnospiraceae bacterium]